MNIKMKIRDYFRNKKLSGIGRFVKKCLFSEEFFFLYLNQKCQKNLIRGDLTSTCPSGLSKCPLVKQRCPFMEAESPFPSTILIFFSFWINNFFIFHNFCLKYFWHIFYTCLMTYGTLWSNTDNENNEKNLGFTPCKAEQPL